MRLQSIRRRPTRSTADAGLHKGGRVAICQAAGKGGPAGLPIKLDDAENVGIPPSSAVPGEASSSRADAPNLSTSVDAADEQTSVSATAESAEVQNSRREVSSADKVVSRVQVCPTDLLSTHRHSTRLRRV